MGEYANMIIDGEVCQVCMCPLEDSLGDFPQTCSKCKSAESRAPTKRKTKTVVPAPLPPLPKWKGEADDDVSVRYHCTHCTRHFPSEAGARDHVRSMHKAAKP